MRSRSRQQQKLGRITGLSLDPDGFAVAHIVHSGTEPPRLEVCSYQPLEPGEEPAAQIAALVREHSLERTPCVFALRPGQYSLRQIDALGVAPEELRDAARWAIKDLVDFDVVEAVVDAFEVPAGGPGRPQRVYVAAAESSEIDEVVALVGATGLELIAIDIAELALRNLSALLPEDERGAAIMVLQGGCGLVVASIDGTLQLARDVHADAPMIEEISRYDAAEPKPDSDEDSMLLDALLLEAQRSLDYCEHQLGLPPIRTVVLGMTDPATPALEQHLTDGLNADVMSLDLNRLLEVDGSLSAAVQGHCLRAVGAALRQESGR